MKLDSRGPAGVRTRVRGLGGTEARGPAASGHEQALSVSHTPVLLGSPPAVSGPASGTPPARGGGAEEAASGPILPGTLTLPAGEPGNKHLIWLRFNTQVKQPCAPLRHPAARALPAPPQPIRSTLGLLAGKVGWDPSALTFGACKELHPLQRQRNKAAGGQALEAPEGSVIVCCFLATGGGGRVLMPTEGRV